MNKFIRVTACEMTTSEGTILRLETTDMIDENGTSDINVDNDVSATFSAMSKALCEMSRCYDDKEDDSVEFGIDSNAQHLEL